MLTMSGVGCTAHHKIVYYVRFRVYREQQTNLMPFLWAWFGLKLSFMFAFHLNCQQHLFVERSVKKQWATVLSTVDMLNGNRITQLSHFNKYDELMKYHDRYQHRDLLIDLSQNYVIMSWLVSLLQSNEHEHEHWTFSRELYDFDKFLMEYLSSPRKSLLSFVSTTKMNSIDFEFSKNDFRIE